MDLLGVYMFSWWDNLSAILVFDILGFVKGTQLGDDVHFFIFDTVKIFILLISIIYFIIFIQSYFPLEKIRV